MARKKIKTNKIKCLNCNDIIESTHVHDFKTCRCKSVSVDGGKEYMKRSFTDINLIEDLSEYEEEENND